MHASVDRRVLAAYRKLPLRMALDGGAIALDESPFAAVEEAIAQMTKRWSDHFEQVAPKLAAWFASSAERRAELGLASALREGGLTVRFDPTPTTTELFRATVAENVSLIRSIGEEHLADVEQLVMRSVTMGRSMGELSKALQARYGVTKRRAALIARDQNNKATAAVVRARQAEAGVEQAVWVHSQAGRHPRPSHVAASGKVYDISRGMYLDGKWVWPGTEINCRCVSRAIIPGIHRASGSEV